MKRNPLLTSLSPNDTEQKTLKTAVLKVRGKTLIFANTIYQISNLSVVDVINLSTVKSVPGYIWLIAILGIGGLLLSISRFDIIGIIVGIALLGVAGYLYTQHERNKLTERYGLRLVTNSGVSTIIVSNDLQFLQRVALTLYNIINSEEVKTEINFSFDQRKIDQSQTVDSAENVVMIGNVSGDVVNNV